MRLLFLFLALVIACRAAPASFNIAPPPAWIDSSLTPATTPTPAADLAHGYDFLLLDRQVNVQAAESFDRTVYRITSPAALGSGARITWSFDPTYEKLTLHHVRVIRDGVVQERLKEERIQIIQQENDLDRHMLNGRLTAFILLDDVRLGDVIDHASTVQGANPVFAGKYMDSFSTGWSVPVRHQRIRVTTPRARPLITRDQGTSALAHTIDRAKTTLVHTWERRDLPVIINEGELPTWFSPYPFAQISEFKTWTEVAAWAVPLYAIPSVIPKPVADKAAELTRFLVTEESKTIALLTFVQDEIRYLGLELGPGTHRPNPPELVLARRFGDCKDKTLLFCTLMRAAGLDAHPALVNTSYRDRIEAWAPSPYAFDHVIACIPMGQSRWWVDPTLTNQKGGSLYRGLPDYRLALPVLADTTQLPQGQIGEIIVAGPTVTHTYDALPEATAAAKISGSGLEFSRLGFRISEPVFHRLGDAGYLDADGRLWFCGRKAERVDTGDGPLFTEQVEPLFNAHPDVRRSALIGLGKLGYQRLAVVIEPTDPSLVADSAQCRRFARELREIAKRHPHTSGIKLFYFRDKFPVDVRHNAKIHRLTLARWAADGATGYESDPKR